MFAKTKKGKLILLLLLFLIVSLYNLWTEQPAMTPAESGELRVHFIDVGQGDSILIELPNDENMLIDGGTRKAGDIVTSYIKGLGMDSLDYIVATHPHEDHIGGLIKVFETIPFDKVYMPKVVHTSKTFETMVNTVADKGKRFQRAKAGVVITETENLKVDILSPVRESYNNLNNYSAVVKVEYNNIGIIFMGDAEKLAEDELDGTRVSAQVLKVGHHGSRTSSSPEFLARVSPTYGIISCGKDNDYGHPHAETLDALRDAGVTHILRTDLSGTIVLTTDGNGIIIDDEY